MKKFELSLLVKMEVVLDHPSVRLTYWLIYMWETQTELDKIRMIR
jgi:hypothetical protein